VAEKTLFGEKPPSMTMPTNAPTAAQRAASAVGRRRRVAAPTAAATAGDPGLVVVLAYDGLALFEFGIATELFGLTRPELGVPWYRFKVASADGAPCRAMGGLEIAVRDGLASLRRARTVVVPGWGVDKPASPALLRALQAAHGRGARFLSICSGAFLLARAGLLDGKQATTHWRYADALRAQFPHVDVVPDVLYVDEGQVITSAGSAAGLDAGLHLIRRDFGSAIANQVARRLVVTPQRSGGQKQFIPAPVYAGASKKFEGVLAWAQAHLEQPLQVKALAQQAAMSERNFLRRFSETTGCAPKAWLQQARMARAKELLETSALPLQQLAERCGYPALETFRAAFRKQVGLAPTAYRARFASKPA
jgi:AraC family transcriptional activator FtrA